MGDLCMFLKAPQTIKLGVIGDSGVDEYRADDNRGGAYAATTLNSIELLATYRAAYVTVGAWGTRSSPRRIGYERNWALSGATAGGQHVSGTGSIVALGQHTGLAAQVAAGQCDTVLIWIGSNDWTPAQGNYEPVYDGTISGATLTAKIASIVGNIEDALDALIAENASIRILVTNAFDHGPYITGSYPNATYRQRVTDAIDDTNFQVAGLIAERSSNVALIDRHDSVAIITGAYPLDGNNDMTVGGEKIGFFDAGDEPHNAMLADGAHAGTVFKGLETNLFLLDRLQAAFGVNIPRFSDAEILTMAGIG
jgi:hypothetical protein